MGIIVPDLVPLIEKSNIDFDGGDLLRTPLEFGSGDDLPPLGNNGNGKDDWKPRPNQCPAILPTLDILRLNPKDGDNRDCRCERDKGHDGIPHIWQGITWMDFGDK